MGISLPFTRDLAIIVEHLPEFSHYNASDMTEEEYEHIRSAAINASVPGLNNCSMAAELNDAAQVKNNH